MSSDHLQPKRKSETHAAPVTRREFLKRSAAVAATATFAGLPAFHFAHAQGTDRLRIGLVGCGGRGTGAARDCLSSSEGLEMYALGDITVERAKACRQNLADFGNKVNVSDDRCFGGFDAYQKVLGSGIDVILLCTPPGFRPLHFDAAVQAGKHIFAEKPIATCPAGVRKFMASAEAAAQKGLSVVAGTQYRHHEGYLEAMRRIFGGEIGTVKGGSVYYMATSPGVRPRQPDWTDLHYQMNNWLFYTWIAGDQIVEQFVHNIDIMCWFMQGHPIRAYGTGGRQVRVDPAYGDVYDHFAIEYEFAGGGRVTAMCRQMDNTATRVDNRVIGTEGDAYLAQFTDFWVKGKSNWTPGTDWKNPYVTEHKVLIESIRANRKVNEGRQVAESTLAAIMGRMAAYTGQVVSWDQAMNSKLNLMKDPTAFGPMPTDPVPMPGKTKLE